MSDTETEIGEIYERITPDYILDLYEKYKNMDLTDEEMEKRVAVLKVFADHIDEHLIIKYK